MPISLVGMDGLDAMKIEHPHVKLEPTGRAVAETGSSPAKAATPQGADAVRLSSDLRLADQAVRATAADASRPDVVARARDLYLRGELGADVERLADRMIDALTHSDGTPH